MDVQKIKESFANTVSTMKDSFNEMVDHVLMNKSFFIKALIIVIIVSGWLFSAYSGGMMGIWACICAGVAGYFAKYLNGFIND
jgi:hypothetical protein